MRRLACLVILLTSSFVPADEKALKEARELWLRGEYRAAQRRFDALVGPAAAIGSSRCLESLGEHDAAQTKIKDAVEKTPKDYRLLARKAELHYLRGEWADAEKTADAAIKENPYPFVARWVRGQVYRDRGDYKKADAEFRTIVRAYGERSDKDDEVKDPEELIAIGQAGAENARWNRISDQFEFILKEVYGDALKHDKNYWQAEYQAGMLLLEKYNRGEGLPALDKALVLNPNAAEVLVGKGIAALQRLELQDAERFVERALKINPNLPEALHLRADLQFGIGNFDQALLALERARKVNPNDEQTLGRVAACFRLQKKDKEFQELATQVRTRNPAPGVFYLALATVLEDRRFYDEAKKHYEEARKLHPKLAQAAVALGLLHMRMGQEKEAKAILDDAFKADEFNVRVLNNLRVLKHLEQYQTIETKHFLVRYDAKTDPALGEYMAEYLERIHADLAKKFKHEPKDRILVEIFNNHTMFSGRVVSLPDLHTIGACTGKMVALVSPNGKGVRKPFNWARVLRHEVVHIFNLDQTQFLVPHWFTEGLAVISEGYDRPQTWNDLLRTRVASNELLNLDTIDLGFMRPRSPQEWNLAYCQAQLYVQYMTKTHGEDKIGAMLEAYREGNGTAAAIVKVCGVNKEAFEAGYRKFLDDVVKDMGVKLEEKALPLAELRQAVKEKPDDADLLAQLAEALIRRDREEARKYATQAREKKANHPLATVVLARLETFAGNNDQARKLLEEAYDEKAPDIRILKLLAKLTFDAGDLKKAAEMFAKGQAREPGETFWLTELVRVHARLDNRDEQIKWLEKLIKTDADDLDSRKRLARLCIEAGKHADAENYARQALEIDIKDRDARRQLFDALEKQNKNDDLARIKKILEK